MKSMEMRLTRASGLDWNDAIQVICMNNQRRFELSAASLPHGMQTNAEERVLCKYFPQIVKLWLPVVVSPKSITAHGKEKGV